MKIAMKGIVDQYKLKCRSPTARRAIVEALACGTVENRRFPNPKTHPDAVNYPVNRCAESFAILITERIRRELEPTDQIIAMCCSRFSVDNCIKYKAADACGAVNGTEAIIPNTDWYYEHYNALSGEIVNVLCGNKYQTLEGCERHAPRVMRVVQNFDDIYAANDEKRTNKALFRTVLDLFNAIVEDDD